MSYEIQYSLFESEDSLPSPSGSLRGLDFQGNGLKMWSLFQSSNRLVEYDLTVAFDISTATISQFKLYSAQDTDMSDLSWGDHGSKLYMVGDDNDSVYEYDVSTPFDISTAVYNQAFVTTTQDDHPKSVCFKADGKKMYVLGGRNNSIYQYDLSTGWDLSTASYVSTFSVSSQILNPTGIFIELNGDYIFVVGRSNDKIARYDFGTAFDLSTLTYSQNFVFSTPALNPSGIYIKPLGGYFYTLDYDTNDVFTYYIQTPDYQISGYVTENLTPIEDAKMRCIKQSDNSSLTPLLTLSTGLYTFTGLDQNELYHVSVEKAISSVDYNSWSYWNIEPVLVLI